TMPAVAVPPHQARTVHDVQLLGVTDHFWDFGPHGAQPLPLARDQVALNIHLARRLDAGVGDELLLKVPRPSLLPRDMLLASRTDCTTSMRCRVAASGGGGDFGRVSLRADLAAPLNAFVGRDALQAATGFLVQVNLALMGSAHTGVPAAARTAASDRLATLV